MGLTEKRKKAIGTATVTYCYFSSVKALTGMTGETCRGEEERCRQQPTVQDLLHERAAAERTQNDRLHMHHGGRCSPRGLR